MPLSLIVHMENLEKFLGQPNFTLFLLLIFRLQLWIIQIIVLFVQLGLQIQWLIALCRVRVLCFNDGCGHFRFLLDDWLSLKLQLKCS